MAADLFKFLLVCHFTNSNSSVGQRCNVFFHRSSRYVIYCERKQSEWARRMENIYVDMYQLFWEVFSCSLAIFSSRCWINAIVVGVYSLSFTLIYLNIMALTVCICARPRQLQRITAHTMAHSYVKSLWRCYYVDCGHGDFSLSFSVFLNISY